MAKSSAAARFLADFSSSRPRAKYATITLYLSAGLARHFRGVAADGGWELADLARTLILAGLSFSLLHVAEGELASETRLTYAVREFKKIITGTVSRPYQTRSGSRRGSWITIRLPEGFLKFLSLYARSTGRSRNRALTLFLKAGLLLYLAGYNKFLRTIITESKSRLTGCGAIHKSA